MMNSNLNLNTLPECKFAYQMVNSALLMPARLKCSALIWLCWSVWL